MSEGDEYGVLREMREKYEAVAGITDGFCREHLNEEYADLSRKMAAALSRERPSPLESGCERSWAAGLTLGRIHSALAYYWDHREGLDRDIQQRLEWVTGLRRAARPSPLVSRLRARGPQ